MLKAILSHNVLGLYLFKCITYSRLRVLRLINSKSESFLHHLKIEEILRKELKADANCIDIGASKGDVLDLIIKACPHGQHIAIEPIPVFCTFLKRYYANKSVHIINTVISEQEETVAFYFVTNEPATSGVTKVNKPIHKFIELSLVSRNLDSLLVGNQKTHCIKVDCVGSELAVFKGAKGLLESQKPLILFECTATHNTKAMAKEMYDLLIGLGYSIFLLEAYPKHQSLNFENFKDSIFYQYKCQFFAL